MARFTSAGRVRLCFCAAISSSLSKTAVFSYQTSTSQPWKYGTKLQLVRYCLPITELVRISSLLVIGLDELDLWVVVNASRITGNYQQL